MSNIFADKVWQQCRHIYEFSKKNFIFFYDAVNVTLQEQQTHKQAKRTDGRTDGSRQDKVTYK